MKNYVLSILCVLFLIQCSSSQEENPLKSIYYSARTRGSSIAIKIESTQLTYNDTIIGISEIEWKRLTELISQIDLKNISELEAPSNDRFRDAALAASIKLNFRDMKYESAQFDHGNPPKELSDLINEILKLAGI